MRVTEPTTAAQYFHLLRSQVRGADRRPLIVFTPKSLLRARQARSPIGDFTAGSFSEVLDDPGTADVSFDVDGVNRVVLCTGKVAYDALARREELGEAGRHVAVVRVEQLYPWPKSTIKAVLDRYGNAREVVWLQEEPENMGAWNFVHGRLHRLLRDTHTLLHVSRAESASPATGSAALHRLEQDDLLSRAIG
jgi:2-oxoglutarate dehydrogenase complex dehydrogenase (E1) component-like enzyme